MQPSAAIDNLRNHGVSADIRARLLESARGDTPEEALARAGRNLSLVVDAAEDRVVIGAALLAEMAHATSTPRVAEQVSTGLSLLGRGTTHDLYTQQTTFRGCLEETEAVRVPLPATKTYLRMPCGGHDPQLAAYNRGVVDDLQRRATEHRAQVSEVEPAHRQHAAEAAKSEELERVNKHRSDIARGVVKAGGLFAAAAAGTFLATGAAAALSAGMLGLGVTSVAWLAMCHFGIRGAVQGIQASLARMQETLTGYRLRDAQTGLAAVESDLAIAAPRVEAYEARRRADDMERLVRGATTPLAEGRIETAEEWVTFNGVRVPRRAPALA